MAKGNLFLGTAARSVGDVVMYRREGSQVSRVRVRKIANPKTEAQCRQRAVMASVVKFYQPLASVLERSFQGLSTAKSYAKFLQVNAAIGRIHNYVIAKDGSMQPFPYQLSNGTIPSPKIGCEESAGKITLAVPSQVPENIATVGDLSKYFIAAGYKAGDVVTFIFVSGTYSKGFYPYSVQFEIDEASATTLTSLGYGLSVEAQSASSDLLNIMNTAPAMAGFSCIISRPVEDGFLRTKSFMAYDADVLDKINDEPTIQAAIASYGNNAGGDNPLVYLDGDELDNA